VLEDYMSHRKIFSIVNEHSVSTVIARYAISMAKACGAELVLYAVHADGSNETTHRYTNSHLEQIFMAASESDVSVSRIIESGNIITLLPKRVQAEKADLLFYPLTPYNRFGADLQRHMIHHLLKTITIDLAIMRAITMTKPHPGEILVPLGRIVGDKEHRLMFLADLAKSFDSQVTLYHQSEEHGIQNISADIALMRTRLERQQIRVVERYCKNDVGKSITAEALAHRNDLIVLGVSGLGVLRRLFFSNPAGTIMHRPPCNIIMFQAAEL
jgi:nucleotide-binding universal stress UspA family protein